ncbi:VOC family protein [uncultured Amnibacterium sp.]|uniref:VOC family protein n=1 Tax=uncultured Amnibacterium sp. TaxID=1631851 RepID=UPI0035CBCDCB
MRTLHPGLRVSDPQASLRFYRALGYTVVGTVPGTELGDLTLLRLPDDEFAALELVHDPSGRAFEVGRGLTHLAVQVDSIDAAVAALSAAGASPSAVQRPGGPDGPRTSWAADPDGHRIELTEWPAGHAAGLGPSDFPG